MRVLKQLFFIITFLFVLIAGEIIVVQGDTIEAQRELIREMTKNPQCLVPEIK